MKETAYLLQAALIGLWWLGLASSQSFFDAFQFAGIPPAAFWSFLLPDIILIGSLSAFRAYRELEMIEYIILGGFGYAALFCVNATFNTQSGWLPTGFMLVGLAYNLFLCFGDGLFRESKSSNFALNALKTMLQIICIWILALVVVPYVILDSFGESFSPQSGLTFWIGSALFIAFSLLGLVSSFFIVRDGGGTPLPLDQTNRLVVSGPYHFVRNPMAIAGVGQGVAVAVLFLSLPILIYSLLGGLVWHLVVRPVEERDMLKRFGDNYLEYQERVGCWLPVFRHKSS